MDENEMIFVSNAVNKSDWENIPIVTSDQHITAGWPGEGGGYRAPTTFEYLWHMRGRIYYHTP